MTQAAFKALLSNASGVPEAVCLPLSLSLSLSLSPLPLTPDPRRRVRPCGPLSIISLFRQNIVITHWACSSVLVTFYILGSDSARAAAGLAATEQALLAMVGNGIVISVGSSATPGQATEGTTAATGTSSTGAFSTDYPNPYGSSTLPFPAPNMYAYPIPIESQRQ